MRSTKAAAAVHRLNARDAGQRYSFGITGSGLFYLTRVSAEGNAERISGDLTMDEFVMLANSTGPQKKERVTKLDQEFTRKLADAKSRKGE
ncbi:MAG: hypothetical protein K0S28_1263 [Paucimonas sp.]|jgi:hypothetical protein|nr:hypothetical protein [Paucimonas sp.]